MIQKPILFITGSYNDLDNQAPIIWKIAQAGRSARVVFLDHNFNLDIDSDPRVRFLRESPSARVDYFYSIPEFFLRFPNRLLIRSTNPIIVKLMRQLLTLVKRWVWTDTWAEALLKKIDPAVFVVSHLVRDHTLEGKLTRAAIRLRIPVIGVSHGPNVYGNVDRSLPSERPYRFVDMTNPTQHSYTRVIASTPYERTLWQEQGYADMEKIVVYGTPRYCDEWVRIQNLLYPSFIPRKDASQKLKVLFFMPHWGEHVNQPGTLEAIEAISKLDYVHLVIKEHTREGAGNLPKALREKFASSPNVEVIESARAVSFKEWVQSGFKSRKEFNIADSTPLVRWADIATCFSTGIGIEVICQEKPLINPVYLYTYASIYDNYGAGIIVRNLQEFILALENANRDKNIPYSAQRFRKAVIYGEKEPHDILESYNQLLTKMANEGLKSND